MEYYVVDVFTDRLFGGNPAGVCLLTEWPGDATMQSIAAENNLSETAFLVKRVKHDGQYDLRWFTPETEIDLCGHATMGSAYVLFTFVEQGAQTLRFHTQSGVLSVTKSDDMLWMDFPSRPGVQVPNYPCLAEALGVDDFYTYRSADIMVVVDRAETVQRLSPDFEVLKRIKHEANMPDDSFGVIVTGPGADCDFVSRFFAPNAGICEDPVTGRAHCVLIPYWSQRLGMQHMTARQLSRRGGWIWCKDAGKRVGIGGKARLYLRGELMM